MSRSTNRSPTSIGEVIEPSDLKEAARALDTAKHLSSYTYRPVWPMPAGLGSFAEIADIQAKRRVGYELDKGDRSKTGAIGGWLETVATAEALSAFHLRVLCDARFWFEANGDDERAALLRNHIRQEFGDSAVSQINSDRWDTFDLFARDRWCASFIRSKHVEIVPTYILNGQEPDLR